MHGCFRIVNFIIINVTPRVQVTVSFLVCPLLLSTPHTTFCHLGHLAVLGLKTHQ